MASEPLNPSMLTIGRKVELRCATCRATMDLVFNGQKGGLYLFDAPEGRIGLALLPCDDGTLRDSRMHIMEVRDAEP